jgi:predicted amidohydrolase
MTTVRIALANIRAGVSRDDSVARAQAAIADAGSQGALVVCFPEAYVPGYRTAGTRLPPPDEQFLDRAWADIASSARDAGIGVVLGTERIVNRRPRIAALVIDQEGAILGIQEKIQLDPSEDATYAAGAERHLFRVGPLTFGVVICHEGWRYPETVRWAARRGAQLVFHPHFHEPEPGAFRPTNFADPRNTFHEKAMLCRAAENNVWFASVNCACEGSPSTSAVIRPDGTVLAWQPYGIDGLLIADLETDDATGLLASRCKTAY